MNDEPNHKHRKYWLLCLFAVFIAIIGIILPEQEDIAFEIVKNDTDLCRFNHTSMQCDGERKNNVTYYTNDSTIILTVYAHANLASQTAGIFVYRDDVLVEAQSGRPLAAPEETWRGVTLIMPRNTSYRVNVTNFHHFNWTEDQIISGKNGTLSIINQYINNTNITGGGASNLSQLTIDTNKDWLNYNIYNVTIDNQSMGNKVNKTGDNMTGNLNMQGNLSIGVNHGSVGFMQNFNGTYPGEKQYGSLVNYASTDGSYVGLTENAYFNTTEQYWYRMNNSRGSLIFQIVAIDPVTNPGQNFSYQFYGVPANNSAVNHRIEYAEFIALTLVTTQTYILYQDFQNTKLAGAGNAYVCTDLNGKIYRGSPGC